ncbi:hypothetical protein B0H11DRAFT_1911902 [Mycena galericulata]|nr:hypothetical protein B0H11DRAFT_1911902 [Mycena galericulata]
MLWPLQREPDINPPRRAGNAVRALNASCDRDGEPLNPLPQPITRHAVSPVPAAPIAIELPLSPLLLFYPRPTPTFPPSRGLALSECHPEMDSNGNGGGEIAEKDGSQAFLALVAKAASNGTSFEFAIASWEVASPVSPAAYEVPLSSFCCNTSPSVLEDVAVAVAFRILSGVRIGLVYDLSNLGDPLQARYSSF